MSRMPDGISGPRAGGAPGGTRQGRGLEMVPGGVVRAVEAPWT